MANVLVCVKRVPDSSSEVVLTEDAQAVDGRYAGFTTSPHEECAVELAVQITGATDGEATVLTLGDADAVEQLRSALAVGCHAATLVGGGGSDVRPGRRGARDRRGGPRPRGRRPRPRPGPARQRRRRLAATSRSGSGSATSSADRWSTAPRWSRSRTAVVTARVEGPDGVETYRVPLPAVVTIREGGVEPRYPSVPGRMKAKKVEVEERPPSAEPSGPKRVKLLLPPPVPSNVQVLGTGAAAAPAVVDLFEELGVLSR